MLFIDRVPAGVIEAKKDEEGLHLTSIEEQTKEYAESKLKYINSQSLLFRYESTGVITRFTDMRDPKPRSRIVFSFHQPLTLQLFLKEGNSLRSRLQNLPSLDKTGLRECQFIAINNKNNHLKKIKLVL